MSDLENLPRTVEVILKKKKPPKATALSKKTAELLHNLEDDNYVDPVPARPARTGATVVATQAIKFKVLLRKAASETVRLTDRRVRYASLPGLINLFINARDQEGNPEAKRAFAKIVLILAHVLSVPDFDPEMLDSTED